MEEIKLQAADGAGEFAAYVYQPEPQTAGGAVVVIQEIFGVNDALRDTCLQLAQMGFIAIAPDLFWRQEPGVNLTDKSEEEWKKAFALMNGFDQDKGVEDLKTRWTPPASCPARTARPAPSVSASAAAWR
jgi:carboxymethylenebutenolidase